MSERNFLEIAQRYADSVISGETPACKYVKQAAMRQQKDLAEGVEGYEFNEYYAARVCAFIELLPQIKGKWANQPLALLDWQVFLLTTVFGWVNEEGKRRYKTAYVEVPRKQGKSTLSSGVALYCGFVEGEGGAEVYAAAVNRDQAKIVWGDAKQMVMRCKPFQDKFDVKAAAHSVFSETTGSSFKALSRDMGGNLDGLNIHCAIVDELHGHPKRDLWEVIETGTGAREQPLIWAITTAGFNLAGICYEQRSYVQKILSGSVEDDSYFGIIYTIDDGDDWTEETSWIKANPSWGVSVNPDDIKRKAKKAMETASAVNGFLTKHLNVWVSSSVAWMNMLALKACEDTSLTPQQYQDSPVWIGVDLASRLDISAVSLIFRRSENDWALFTECFLPEDTVHESPNSQYQGWVRDGTIVATDGNTTDYAVIEARLRELCEQYNVQGILFDPYQATYIMTKLAEDGLPVQGYPNSVRNMASPMAELEAMVMAKKIKYDGNPCLTWQFSNVVAKQVQDDYFVPRKEIPQNKIDSVVAAIMALGKAMEDTVEDSIYESRGILTL